MMKHLEVVAAVIKVNNKYLCMQRNVAKYDYISYKFEFPGGKVELGETNEQALKRELQEEMNYDVKVNDLVTTVNYKYPDFEITMHAYLCSAKDKNFIMKEHVDSKWLSKEELNTLDWAAADRPVVEAIQKS